MEQDDAILTYASPKLNMTAVIGLLAHQEQRMLILAIRIVGLIASGQDQNVDSLLAAGGAEQLLKLLNPAAAQTVLKECLWALSNIAAGNNAQKLKILGCGVLEAISTLFKEMQVQEVGISLDSA